MQFISSWIIILFTLIIHKETLVVSEALGDSCTDTSNLNGTCAYIYTCPHILNLKYNNIEYKRCGFDNGKEVVCCARRNIMRGSTERPPTHKKYVRECEQYKSKMFDIELFFTSLTAGARPTNKMASKCSQHTFPLVVGGEDANPKEFPHMALLGCKKGDNLVWACGGSLISLNYVLTAAHCFTSTKCDDITLVRLGDLDVESTSDDAQPKDFDVEKIELHPNYNNSLKYDDIALVKLATKVEMNLYIRPACLPYSDYKPESQLIITGWGSKQLATGNAPHLQKAPVELFEQNECNEIYTEDGDVELPTGIKETTQICAGSRVSNRDTCQGDSGGPLQVVHPNYPCMYSIIGVTSYGQGCGSGDPGVYTRVYNYNDWIESVVWA